MRLDISLAYLSAGIALLLAIGGAVRARRILSRWTFVGSMILLAAERLISAFVLAQDSALSAFRWEVWRLTASSFIPGAGLLLSLTYARANSEEFLRKWKFAVAATFLAPLATVLVYRSELISATEYATDVPAIVFRLSPVGTFLCLQFLAAAVLILVNLEHTFRSAVGTVRWRIKFFLLGNGVVYLVVLFTASQALLFRALDPRIDVLRSGSLLLGALLIVRSLFRTGHFNLDVHPSQSVLQGSVTVVLVGVYLLLVGALAKVVSLLGGDSSFGVKALVVLALLVLLAIILQSDRVRLYVRRFVSRHFQRPIHDYRTIWRQFTEGTASRVELHEYCRAVVKLVAEIFESLSVTLWVLDERDERLALVASTGMSDRQGHELQPTVLETELIRAQFQADPEPANIEGVPAQWAEVLRRCNPDEFHKGGSRVCVPVMAGRDVLAVVLLGDRVSGAAFSIQDYDLLKSIGDQVASGLRNARLSQRLLQAREHEAFQTMATFFVHDLKNAASTLNLMLQNLPDHFDDPEFRKDALRGIGKSVDHINHLITRLTQLRSELRISPVDSDLNTVLLSVLESMPPEQDFTVTTQLAELPRSPLDREQFSKVIINLVLNAREACNGKGTLAFSTSRTGSWLMLEASDNGPGIPAEFLARSLFRPFQTTKKNGLGIGMFQSKMIIEAHGGKITVESAPGHGATFRIFLPLPSQA